MKSLHGLSLLFLLAILSLSSCDDDNDNPSDNNDTAQLELNFKLTYEGNSLHGFEEATYPLGYDFFLTKLSFFLSNSQLISDGSSVPLFDAAFVDILKDVTDQTSAEQGVSIMIDDAPVGEYDGVTWNIGVDSIENAKNPSDFANSSALALNGEYWAGWESYIFHKIEGKIDSDGDGSFSTNVALHIGSDMAFRQSTIDRSFSIAEGQDNKLSFTIELSDLITVNGAAFDIQALPQVHQEGQLGQVMPLMDNLATAIK